MGGYGSGPQDNKCSTSAAKRIDIRYMRRQGLLRHGRVSLLHWKRGGEAAGHIRYTVYADALGLDYKVSANGGEWRPIRYSVQLEAIPCRYGGERRYFRCPDKTCNRRCEVLYLTQLYFLCRRCSRHLYPSQKGDKLDKLRWAREQIGERIFEDWDGSGGWRKRKWMHRRTFERAVLKYQKAETDWNIEYRRRAELLLS